MSMLLRRKGVVSENGPSEDNVVDLRPSTYVYVDDQEP